MDHSELSTEVSFAVEYFSTASNFLMGLIIAIYIPLILSPLLIVQLDAVTALMMIVLVVVLSSGIIVFRLKLGKQEARLLISPGDARIEGKGSAPLILKSKGLSSIDNKSLKSAPNIMFETRIFFQSKEDCSNAESLIRSYY